jgi:hypothetical protein
MQDNHVRSTILRKADARPDVGRHPHDGKPSALGEKAGNGFTKKPLFATNRYAHDFITTLDDRN